MVRHGKPPYLECSSKGEKRLSAFYARPSILNGKSIEEAYQWRKRFADGSTGLTWREAKGRKAVNITEVRELYSELWDAYIAENHDLAAMICRASGLSDIYGKKGSACQATELWRIRTSLLEKQGVIFPHIVKA